MKQAMKIRIKNEAHSKAVQEKLFEMGCFWYNGGATVQFTDKAALYKWAGDSSIMFASSDYDDPNHFSESDEPEYVLHNGELVPVGAVSSMSPQIVDKPIVSDGGSSSYYALTITNKAGEKIEVETGDVIAALVGDNFALGNVVKALRRMYECSQGRGKASVDITYDANKCKYFLDDFVGRYGK